MYDVIQNIQQLLQPLAMLVTVHLTSFLATMEGACLLIIGVTAIMTVEITVMKRDVVHRLSCVI